VEETEIHHIVPKKFGGGDEFSNLLLLHKECHKQLTYTKSEKLKARFIEQKALKELISQ
jgi:5-methylcytosine-specific restriction endonuclease McrA